MKRGPMVGLISFAAVLLIGCSAGSGGSSSTPTSGVAITAFTANAAQVNQGQSATLSWTLSGTASTLTLDGVALPVSQSSASVSPIRRQTYTLVATGGGTSDTKTVTVAARGLSFFAGDPAVPGTADGSLSAARFNQPFYLARDGQGNLYVDEWNSHTIRKITPQGQVSTLAGLPGVPGFADGTGSAARFDTPRGLAVEASGSLIIHDFNYVIRRLTQAGAVSTFCGNPGVPGYADGTGTAALFKAGNGLALDAQGNIILADSNNKVLRKITPTGTATTLAGVPNVQGSGDGNAAAATFGYPEAPVVLSNGDIILADMINHTLRKLSNGQVTTLAGLAGVSGFLDGTGTSARLGDPGVLSLGPDGNIYFVDFDSHTVRKVTPGGVVTTVAGIPGVTTLAEGPLPQALGSPLGLLVLPTGDLLITSNHALVQITAP